MKKLSDLFEIRYGHSLELNRLKEAAKADGFPFVSRKMGDNGVAAYVQRVPGIEPYPAGDLTCALSGNGVLSTFIQDHQYYTGYHVACLKAKIPLSRQELLYYCACIRANRYRYSYGRQANRTLGAISLPDPSQIPAWAHDADVDAFGGADDSAEAMPVILPPANEWRPFRLSPNLFTIKKGKRLTKAQMVPGETPFIGAIDSNNGVAAFVGQPPQHPANTLTVVYNGAGVGEAFYQTRPFCASDDVNILYPAFLMNAARALFVAAVLRGEKYRFSYGRKWHKERMEAASIRLPANPAGEPDWARMEAYILSLPFSSQILA